MKTTMFVAVAQHNTGHGEVATPICLSEDIEIILRAARAVDVLGYQFYADETGVVVSQVGTDQMIFKKDAKVIFVRRHRKHGVWEEEWIDESFKPKL